MEIKITRAQTLKEKPDSSHLVFGTNMTDHMFIADYDEGQGVGRGQQGKDDQTAEIEPKAGLKQLVEFSIHGYSPLTIN